MNKPKISHEVPLCLLDKSREFNDYDYLLPHLMDESEEYKNFFIESKKQGRYIMMDNSLHELGIPYSEERLLYWLEQIQPNEFFVPDYWEDEIKSVKSATKWAAIQRDFPNIKFIAVVQGKTFYQALNCYNQYKELGYNKIAFSYGASYYNDFVPHSNKHLGKALGRIQVITKLLNLGIIQNNHRIHLLGCSVPQEFGWYSDMPFIESIDTSNPIMAALDNTRYSGFGLYDKPKSCMNDNLHINIEAINIDILNHNIQQFRLINDL